MSNTETPLRLQEGFRLLRLKKQTTHPFSKKILILGKGLGSEYMSKPVTYKVLPCSAAHTHGVGEAINAMAKEANPDADTQISRVVRDWQRAWRTRDEKLSTLKSVVLATAGGDVFHAEHITQFASAHDAAFAAALQATDMLESVLCIYEDLANKHMIFEKIHAWKQGVREELEVA